MTDVPDTLDLESVEQVLLAARRELLDRRTAGGVWEGELSSSALSTATAVCALALLDNADHSDDLVELVRQGVAWLAEHQNIDGGWGDTVNSPSNISTTTLCWAALGAGWRLVEDRRAVAERAEAWLRRRAKDLSPAGLARAITAVYGRDRTFSIPILTMCALSGRFGTGRDAWRSIPALPFELAALPHTWFSRIGLPVVSYALPALIAVGQVRHHHRPTRNPVTRLLRRLARPKTLRVLQAIQPESGGFLEATPLTSFVMMSLVSAGEWTHPVVQRGRAFLAESVRTDGSWPIDTNLSTWLTTLSVNALHGGSGPTDTLSTDELAGLRRWLLGQQHRREHPYTHAAGGGWAWTDLSGGVPDADDTAGVLLALRNLTGGCGDGGSAMGEVRDAVTSGVRWLVGLQNRDGGMPTFCRGWGKLPFDRSTADLTAHALRAWCAWRDTLPYELREQVRRAMHRAVEYLVRTQRRDGAWVPLWFGNQKSPKQESPLYGTSRVLRAGNIVPTDGTLAQAWTAAGRRAVDWVLSAQNKDGGWGGAAAVASSVEETALAVEALAGVAAEGNGKIAGAIGRGCAYLVNRTEGGTRFEPAPIGLYFARLWYYESLYPLVYTVSALEHVLGCGDVVGRGVNRSKTSVPSDPGR